MTILAISMADVQVTLAAAVVLYCQLTHVVEGASSRPAFIFAKHAPTSGATLNNVERLQMNQPAPLPVDDDALKTFKQLRGDNVPRQRVSVLEWQLRRHLHRNRVALGIEGAFAQVAARWLVSPRRLNAGLAKRESRP